jgi:hypothetical protein
LIAADVVELDMRSNLLKFRYESLPRLDFVGLSSAATAFDQRTISSAPEGSLSSSDAGESSDSLISVGSKNRQNEPSCQDQESGRVPKRRDGHPPAFPIAAVLATAVRR